ncbi:bis(5'-nucleosyl)-tetraphosphatase [Thiocapsa marina]|uniref:Bis(5'-nucleosyl)-tetraphosphatase [asymmetrical] n=1 Tax=Thiocapsa marina 5811 TaxID=768671 RepID=F9UA88_9GAMM|nr:NUDIX domain-containing protein [Thiocapsa marina]EGV19036.1 NUDIX hydrolase [Thiocapsa marina 5811]
MKRRLILSAGVVPVRRIGSERRFLILRCYSYWDFPKGETEPGEDPLSAARREVAEETGLIDLDFRWGSSFVETPPYGRGKVARYYLAETSRGDVALGINPQLGFPEHQEFRWATEAEARTLLNDRVGAVLDWAVRRIGESPGAPAAESLNRPPEDRQA